MKIPHFVWTARDAVARKFTQTFVPVVVLYKALVDKFESAIGHVRVFSGHSFISGVYSFNESCKCGPERVTCFAPESVQRCLPIGIDKLSSRSQHLFRREANYSYSEGGYLKIEEAQICARPYAIVLKDRRVVSEASKQINRSIFQHPVVAKRVLKPDLEVQIAWASHFHAAFNYYHWMFNILPLLVMPPFRELIRKHSPTLIIPRFQFSFQKESFEMLEFSHLKVLNNYDYDVLRAQELHVPVLPDATDQAHPAVITALRTTFLPKVSQASKRSRIYLTRLEGKRCVTNEEEIQPILDKYEISTVRTGDMSFQSQVELFASTELVIAPHGAAIANIVFLPRGSSILEFFSPTFINPCYWRIANACGCDYALLLGKAYHTFEPSSDSYRICPNELGKMIGRLLEFQKA